MPDIQINFLAVIIAVVASFVFAFLWYTPIFGKLWGREMGFDPDMKPEPGVMIKGMLIMLVGNFLLVWVFANNMAVWNPATWGLEPSEISPFANGMMAAVFTWLGFFFPVDIGSVTWEQKSWTLFFINTGYHLLNLVLVAMILSYM
ncbi:MAG: DUF1761 domain-containing protein [Vicingaceae bacterium]